MKPAEELAELWVTSELDMQAIEAVSISTWKTYQLVYFLDKILQKSPLPPGKDSGLPPYHAEAWLLGCRASCQRPERDSEGIVPRSGSSVEGRLIPHKNTSSEQHRTTYQCHREQVNKAWHSSGSRSCRALHKLSLLGHLISGLLCDWDAVILNPGDRDDIRKAPITHTIVNDWPRIGA